MVETGPHQIDFAVACLSAAVHPALPQTAGLPGPGPSVVLARAPWGSRSVR